MNKIRWNILFGYYEQPRWRPRQGRKRDNGHLIHYSKKTLERKKERKRKKKKGKRKERKTKRKLREKSKATKERGKPAAKEREKERYSYHVGRR